VRCVRVNDKLAALEGSSFEAHLGQTAGGLHGILALQAETLLRQVAAAGIPVTDVEVTGETSMAPGEQRHWQVN
jgi:hypothetical protein